MGIWIRASLSRVKRLNRSSSVTLVIVLLLTSACGFSLRSELLVLTDGLQVTPDVSREVHIAIERYAQRHNISLNERSQVSSPAVYKVSETLLERPMRIDGLGRVTQYRISLRWNATYSVAGSEYAWVADRMENAHIDEESVIGFEKERLRITDALREELVELLLRTIALRQIHSNAKTP